MSFWFLSPRRRYCMLWNSQQRPLVFETVILQAIARARMHQRITVVSAHFDYMRVADTIDSQKSEDRDITEKSPKMLLATIKVPRMQSQIFYFHTDKIYCVLYTSYYYFQILDLKIWVRFIHGQIRYLQIITKQIREFKRTSIATEWPGDVSYDNNQLLSVSQSHLVTYLRGPGFPSRSVHVEFVVNRVALG
jgi:hypothetical protein